MDYTKDINNIIEKVLTEKTFNLEIVEEIKKLRELPEQLTQAKEQIDSLLSEREVMRQELEAFNKKEADLDTKEKELIKKERELEIQEIKSKFAEQRANEIKELFTVVFRNQQVREDIYKQTPVVNNGYTQMESITESKDITVD